MNCVRKGEGLGGQFQLQAASHPLSSLESVSVVFKCFYRRRLSVILDGAGQGGVILSCQHWALVACSPLDAVLPNVAVDFGGYVLPVLPGVKVQALLFLLFNSVRRGGKKNANFCEKGRKGDGTAF